MMGGGISPTYVTDGYINSGYKDLTMTAGKTYAISVSSNHQDSSLNRGGMIMFKDGEISKFKETGANIWSNCTPTAPNPTTLRLTVNAQWCVGYTVVQLD